MLLNKIKQQTISSIETLRALIDQNLHTHLEETLAEINSV